MEQFISLALDNKDVWSSLILIWIILVILYPLLRKGQKQTDTTIDLLRQEHIQNKKHNDKVITILEEQSKGSIKQLTNIFNEIANHNQNSNREFEYIKENIFNTKLDDEKTVRILKTEMWYVTEKKLEFIKSMLENNHIKGREDKIKEKLIVWLEWYSWEYYASFKGYNTPIWDLWTWLDVHFNSETFKEFCSEIFDVIIANYEWDKEMVTNQKVNEIRNIMKRVQNWLANKLRSDLVNKTL